MKFTIATVLALAAGATAAPSIAKRTGVAPAGPTDAQILNFALTLEHLENAFYSDALKKFNSKDFTHDGFSPYVRGRLQQVADHEASHVKVIESVLTTMAGGTANQFVVPCEYTFSYKTPHDFTALSAVIENVGVSAYLGAAGAITNKDILTAAGSILTTEARHQAWINSVANKGTPWSGAYDAPLSINEVYTLAAGFITKCPDENKPFLPTTLAAFPALTFLTTNLAPGKQAQFSYKAAQGGATPTSVAFTGTAGTVFAPITSSSMVVIPQGLQGTYYAVLTTASTGAVTDDTIQAGPAILNFGLTSNARQI